LNPKATTDPTEIADAIITAYTRHGWAMAEEVAATIFDDLTSELKRVGDCLGEWKRTHPVEVEMACQRFTLAQLREELKRLAVYADDALHAGSNSAIFLDRVRTQVLDKVEGGKPRIIPTLHRAIAGNTLRFETSAPIDKATVHIVEKMCCVACWRKKDRSFLQEPVSWGQGNTAVGWVHWWVEDGENVYSACAASWLIPLFEDENEKRDNI